MKSIFSRLILSFAATILITLISIGVLFSGFIRDYLIKQKENELVSKGSQVVELSRDFLNNRISENTFSFVLNSIDEVVNSQTFIVDRSGIILNSPLRFGPGRGAKFNDKDLARVFSGSTVVKSSFSLLFSEPMITVGIPVYAVDEYSPIIGAIILTSPVTGITNTANKVNTVLILASIGALIFSLLTAFFLSRTLSRPIHTISKAAVEIAEGNYSKKVDIKRRDEIGSLALSFNYLTDKLNNTIGALNNEKSKLSGILYSMEEGLIAVDNSLNIIHINPAASFLLNMGNTPALYLSDIKDSRDVIENVIDVLSGVRGRSYEKKISENRFINIMISPLRFQNGTIYGAIILIQDISESVKLEKMRRDFVANVSHELRTPLTSIRGFIEPLIDGTVDDKASEMKYHKIIRNETIRLERLINDLLDLSRLQSGKIALDIQKVNVVELISNISVKFQPLFDAKDIKFIFDKPERPVFILADGARIEQLMVIFIDNATKFTPKGGSIEIGLSEEDSLVRISVKDDGIGIPPEDIPYIWERFYKVDKSRTDKDSGTGLGLSIAKNIIELHGQKVSVKSKAGEGTVFEFTMKREA